MSFLPMRNPLDTFHAFYSPEEVVTNPIDELHSLFANAAKAENRLSEIEAKAHNLQRTREVLTKLIFIERGIFATIRRLPFSVLSHLFGFVVATHPDEIAHLRLVCRAWQKAASQPHLWSNITIVDEDCAAERKVCLFMKKSGRSLLNIIYVQSLGNRSLSGHALPWRAWNTLGSEISRWKTLSLYFFDCGDATHRMSALSDAPRLEELRIDIRPQNLLAASGGNFALTGRPPLLRRLVLRTHVLPYASHAIFRGLTKLHICDTYTRLDENISREVQPIKALDVLRVLMYCCALQDFSFDAGQTYQWFVCNEDKVLTFMPTFRLNSLRRLHLDCHLSTGQLILKYMTPKALEFASIAFRPRHLSTEAKATTSTRRFLSRTQELQTLHIRGLNECIATACDMKKLRELHVQFCWGLETIMDRILEGLYAPALSRIIIDAEECDIPDEKLERLVKERFLANLRFGAPRVIRGLVLNGRDMLAGMKPGKMAKFERKKRFQAYT